MLQYFISGLAVYIFLLYILARGEQVLGKTKLKLTLLTMEVFYQAILQEQTIYHRLSFVFGLH